MMQYEESGRKEKEGKGHTVCDPLKVKVGLDVLQVCTDEFKVDFVLVVGKEDES